MTTKKGTRRNVQYTRNNQLQLISFDPTGLLYHSPQLQKTAQNKAGVAGKHLFMHFSAGEG